MRRGGFTFIELLMVVTIIGVLASIAVPKYHTIKRRAQATQIVGDVDVVKVAVMNFYVDSGYFPREAPAGQVPTGMHAYLPRTFTFRKDGWTLDYENVNIGSRRRPNPIIGVAFTASDRTLGAIALSLFGPNAGFAMGSKSTVIISSP
jgi:prepilin-type N-terminal cleavage/methylation domain-containing protein